MPAYFGDAGSCHLPLPEGGSVNQHQALRSKTVKSPAAALPDNQHSTQLELKA